MKQKQETNKFIRINRPGGPEVLELVEESIPLPNANEVLVRVIASGVAVGDIMLRKGISPTRYPMTPGYDIVGEISDVGSAVIKFKSGDRVAALIFKGGYTSYINLPEDHVVPVPGDLNPAEVVSLVLNYTTAYNLLTRAAKLQSGDSVLIHGAAGGVGTAVLQLCRLLGIKAYGTVSTKKMEVVTSEGGIPIDYTKTDFVKELKRLTTSGVDAVLDPIGGSHLFASYKALKLKGRLVLFGAGEVVKSNGNGKWELVKSMLPYLMLKLLPKFKSTTLYSIKSKGAPAVIAHMIALLKSGQIKPIIARKFPLSEARAAQQFLEFEKPVGKVVLQTVVVH